jgi:hypothetical protein
MLTPRRAHAAVYHTPLRVMRGNASRWLSERYACTVNRWEALPVLLLACSCASGVVVEMSLYAQGVGLLDLT